MKHIELPLKQQGSSVYDASGEDFCYCPGVTPEEARAKAQAIVQAVNSYDVQLATLQAVYAYLSDQAADQDLSEPFETISAGLALLLVQLDEALAPESETE